MRARRRGLLGLLVPLLVPLLVLNWVGAAAMPCAAMGTATSAAAASTPAADAGVRHAHDAGHDSHGTAQAPAHPACPHCVHATAGVAGNDAAAHAGCGEAPANTVDDARRSAAKQDLGVAILDVANAWAPARAVAAAAIHDSDAIPPPTAALYLTLCVFLN